MTDRILAYAMLLIILLTGCNQQRNDKEKLLDSRVVTNPNSASSKGSKDQLPVITFEESEHDFGKIIEGESVSYKFNFTNTGKEELVIADVSTSCGCTVASYPRTAIQPGEAGSVSISFNSKGRRGYQTKTIVVVANTQPNVTQLKIKAQVITPGSD